jgi:predicted transcriptional regulator
MADVLACSKDGIVFTRIMQRANLTHGQCRIYTGRLIVSGLLEVRKEGKWAKYFVTAPGLEFIALYEKIARLSS